MGHSGEQQVNSTHRTGRDKPRPPGLAALLSHARAPLSRGRCLRSAVHLPSGTVQPAFVRKRHRHVECVRIGRPPAGSSLGIGVLLPDRHVGSVQSGLPVVVETAARATRPPLKCVPTGLADSRPLLVLAPSY